MSADGVKQTAVAYNGQIYVSTDSGNTWEAKDDSRQWQSVAMSSDGTKQTAVGINERIYVSTDSGNIWEAKGDSRQWQSVAMSSDGTKQTAVVTNGRIYVSIDSGNTWEAKDSPRNWRSVAMSDNGLKQIAVVHGGQIYVSNGSQTTTASPVETLNLAGMKCRKVTKTHSFVVGDWIYKTTTDDTFAKAKSDVGSTSEAVGVVVKVNGTTDFWYVSEGYVNGLSGLTKGEVQWISAATAGTITETKPSVVGQIEKPVGVALSDTEMNVNIMRGTTAGGTNLYSTIALADNATTSFHTIQADIFSGGWLSGTIKIDATTDYAIPFFCMFSRPASGTYNVATNFGSDIPSGLSITNSGSSIQVVMPAVTGFSSASVTYCVQAAANGATLPVSVSASSVLGSTSAPGAGVIGEYKEATGSDTSMSSAQFNDGGNAGLTLGVGVWDLQATGRFLPADTTTVNIYQIGIGTASGNNGTGVDNNRNITSMAVALAAPLTRDQKMASPLFRVVITSGTVTYYPKCYAEFAVSTMTSNGYIMARRVG
jgi:hypothetical protein